MECTVEIVKVDVGQKRREDSTNAKGNFEFVRQVRFREKRD